jgi:ATP-binding cassette, subfamily C, bacterial CydD
MMINPRLAALAFSATGWFLFTVALGLLASAAAVGQGILTGRAIAGVIEGEAVTALTWLFVAVAALIAGRALLLWGQSIVAAVLGATVKLRLRRRMYARLLELGPGYTVNLRSGEVQATLGDGLEALDPYVSKYLPQAIIALVVPLCVVVLIAAIDLRVGAIVLVSALLLAFGPRLWRNTLGRAGERHWATWRTVAARFVEGLMGMITLESTETTSRWRVAR